MFSKKRFNSCFSALILLAALGCGTSPNLAEHDQVSAKVERPRFKRIKIQKLDFAEFNPSSQIQMEQKEASGGLPDWARDLPPYALLALIFLLFGIYLGFVWRRT